MIAVAVIGYSFFPLMLADEGISVAAIGALIAAFGA